MDTNLRGDGHLARWTFAMTVRSEDGGRHAVKQAPCKPRLGPSVPTVVSTLVPLAVLILPRIRVLATVRLPPTIIQTRLFSAVTILGGSLLDGKVAATVCRREEHTRAKKKTCRRAERGRAEPF
jgi:hypothetical protein